MISIECRPVLHLVLDVFVYFVLSSVQTEIQGAQLSALKTCLLHAKTGILVTTRVSSFAISLSK